jgi:hypothetical protein
MIKFSSLLLFIIFVNYFKIDNDKAHDSIIAFLSIGVGFCVTAISLLASSNFSKKLYSIESRKNNSMTLFHEFIAKFKKTFGLCILTILIVFIYKFLSTENQTPATADVYLLFHYYKLELNFYFFKVSIVRSFNALIWFFLSLSLISFTEVVNLFVAYVEKNVTES